MSALNSKVAIVTGASKGIGAGIARGLAAAGAAVVVNYASSRQGADGVVAEIKGSGGRAVAVQADVSQASDVPRLFEAAKSSFGGVDILVNNAGVFEFEPLEVVTETEFHRQFDTNVLGTIFTIQEAVKHFGPQGGSVINISSVASLNPQPNSLVYAATKAAVDSITLSMSRELGARNIRVNAIAPGGVDTEGLKRVGIVGSEVEKQLIALTPLGRFGQPQDIARVAVFLASDEASWLTGERITASGGWR
ncbi:glucose 1-dehydrogenase [Mesorhizobium sp. M9A.F.Ca.ET.002.03.1.2]|uniref:SDR family NAD(P)-dependent oxidoreductase n=1 Tax=Mesorhizobium sp. M9A.F.Ca.ET.002.03.1.2 TaxID=2493668 RepID=UPI000F74E053|nr:glucose 1-dehydrogenase [Mesorhizobium sp. M9A.F.Ca.ET.002.03.1.2]AZO00767.1 glucose 1-dehydrogenase [Mesorhizobium sp. M9A.F.Ca.ET.002.03.1.2]